MATKEIVYLTFLDAVENHFELMEYYGEIRFGVDSRELLQSALARPQNAAVYENADVHRQAATLCFGLVKNHPWLGGNKRTATYLMETFLEMNGFELIVTDKETYEIVLLIESDIWKMDEIENWLREKVSKTES